MGAIQSGINQSISIAAMLYTQTGHYDQQKVKKVNEATRARINEINKNYGLDKENMPENLRVIGEKALTELQEQGKKLIEPLEEELRQRADRKMAKQDLKEHFESAMENELEHPTDGIMNPKTKEESPAAQATKDAEKGVSEARAQKKQMPRYQKMHDKRKIAREKEKENKLKGGN